MPRVALGALAYMARNLAIGHGVFVALFTASGLLFRYASVAGLFAPPERF